MPYFNHAFDIVREITAGNGSVEQKASWAFHWRRSAAAARVVLVAVVRIGHHRNAERIGIVAELQLAIGQVG